MDLQEARKTVIGWLEEIKTWYPPSEQKWEDYILTDREWIEYLWPQGIPDGWEEESNRLHLVLYTKIHEYHISIWAKEDDGYLGATVKTRKCRAGENWRRGNDLSGGKLSRETWDEILKDIIRWELIAKVKEKIPVSESRDMTIPNG